MPCCLPLGLLAPRPGTRSGQQGELSELESCSNHTLHQTEGKRKLETTGATDEGEDGLVRTGSE